MKNTLAQLGHEFTEQNEILNIMKTRYPISINATTGQISFDSDQTLMVNKIKQTYSVNFFRDRAIKEGMKVQQEVLANGEIELFLTN
jgi:hypothetical protein